MTDDADLDTDLDAVATIMRRYAERTGLGSQAPSRRYLWTGEGHRKGAGASGSPRMEAGS